MALYSSTEWYHPGEFRFTHDQVIWVVRNLAIFQDGYWPSHPLGKGEEVWGKRSGQIRASFETPSMISGEILRRINRCGLEGVVFKMCVALGEDEHRVGQLVGWKYGDTPRKMMNVATYISGWRGKSRSFYSHVHHREEKR